MNRPDISIIIVNHNTSQLLYDCIASIYAKTKDVLFEVIVVDNGSADGSQKMLATDPRLRFVENHENLGYGKANNLGVEVAKGNILLFLNPDTRLRNNAIEKMYHYLLENEDVAIVGGNLFDANGKPTHSFSRLNPSIFQEIDFATKELFSKILFGKNRQFNYSHHPLVVAYITGADLMIRREVFEDAGGFDKDFFMYYEDAALCRKVAQRHWHVISLPDAEIMHYEGQSFKFSELREEQIQKGRQVYFSIFYSSVYNKLADALNIFTLKTAIIICKLFRKRNLQWRYVCRYNIYKKINRK